VPSSNGAHFCARRRNINPNDEIMGSTPSGSAKLMTGAALPPHQEIDRDGGSRASVGRRV
jgi:hypothetical protein